MNRNWQVDEARVILGMSARDGAEEAKKKYREMAKIWHPDVNPSDKAPAKMQEVNAAFALLMREEFGILNFWKDYNRWWWRQYGNDPIWGNYHPESENPGRRRKAIKR